MPKLVSVGGGYRVLPAGFHRPWPLAQTGPRLRLCAHGYLCQPWHSAAAK